MYSTFYTFISSLLRSRIHTKNVFYAFALIAIGFFVVMPLVSLAITPGLVPCGLSPLHGFSAPQTDICTICDLFLLIQNLLNKTFTYFAMPIGALMLAFGGFTMVYQGVIGGSPQSMQKGKKIITNAAIGLLIIFASWLIIDTILKAVGAFGPSSRFGPWNEIKCKAAPPIPATHKGCSEGQCVKVPGSGVDKCTGSWNCDILFPRHHVCNKETQTCDSIPCIDGELCVDTCQIGAEQCKVFVCSPKELAEKYGNPIIPAQNSPRINELISCISKLEPYGLKMSDLGEQSTYDKSNPNCNYTRGNKAPECGINTCSHSIGSCHYGGSKGISGALAVDFGGDGREGAWERDKGDQAIKVMKFYCGSNIKSIRCESAAGKTISPCSLGGATHIHISTYGDTCN